MFQLVSREESVLKFILSFFVAKHGRKCLQHVKFDFLYTFIRQHLFDTEKR